MFCCLYSFLVFSYFDMNIGQADVFINFAENDADWFKEWIFNGL